MKIYVVTQGDYSDYHIITATTDEDLAHKIADKFSVKYDEAKVEIYENAQLMLQDLWYVKFDKNGNSYICKNVSEEISSYCTTACQEDALGQVYVIVRTDIEERAIKIAAEKRAEYLARKLGLV